jgi:hypothetical protein
MKKRTAYTAKEWESICTRCGKCCLIKLEDEDSGQVYYTDVVCRYFDQEKGGCTVYDRRTELVPTCLKLTAQNVDQIPWMPRTCAYRKLFESGHQNGPRTTVCGRCISEDLVKPEDLEDHIVDWEDL